MKQFTFSAQVANNLLTVLQGYSKTIRLLLVMFLTLTVSANVWGAEITYTHQFTTKPSIGNNTLSTITWGVEATNLNNYNNGYAGVQFGTSKANGSITLTSVNAWGEQANTSYTGYTNVKYVYVWLNAGSGTPTATVTIGGKAASKSGTVSKNTAADGNYENTSKLTFTPTSGGNTGVIVITASTSSKAGYIAAIEVVCETPAASCTTPPTVSAAGSPSNITSTTATVSCSGGITSLGSAGCSIESYGFVYGTSSNPTISNTKVQVGTTYTTTGTAFSKELTGLTANTTYYVRPYATNGNGTAYGTQTSFKTLELPKYTVTLKDDNSTLTQSTAGATITLPSRDGCDGYEFVGWTKTWNAPQTSWTTTAPTIIPDGSYTPTANESLYPVYTKTEGGGSEPTAYSAGDEGDFVIASYNTSNSKWYAIPETPTLSSSKIAGVEITVSQTAGDVNYVSTANAEGYTWTIADATNGQTISDGTQYIYHSNGGASGTNLAYGTSTSYTWKIEKENNGLTFKGMSGSTTNSRGLLFNGSVFGGYALSNEDQSGYYRIQVLPIGGGSTTSYISVPDCITQPSYSVTSTLSHVTAAGGNPTTITSEAEDLTLTYLPEDGWNLPATISVTMGGTPLSSETDYDWDNGDLLIAPASGFTGNIVVTVNGWQQLAAPENPKTTNITATSATLSWDEVANASSYLVTIVDGGDLSADIPNTQTSHTFEGLTPSTDYLWTVKAIGDGITYTNSEESETAEFTTLKACEQLGAATDLTVETDFVQDEQTYVKFSWTPADNTKANATNQKICFGKVDEAGTCVDNLAKNLTWTGDLKSKLEPGEYWWSIQALGDGVNYCDGDVVNGTNFTIEAPKASITLSELGVTTTDNTTYYVGAQYTLPTTSSQSCAGKQLVGWSTVEVDETNTKPTSNYYELGAEVTLAATQTFYAVFATKGGVPSTDYNHITSIEDLTDGNYVIAYGYNTTSPTIILKAETKDETTLVATSAGPTDNKYTDPAASNIWEIKKTNTTYTLYNAATSKYIQATNTPSLKLADADPTEFQISYSTDHWKIKLNTANTYQLVGYTNASGNYFQTKGSPSNSYKIQLYKSASTVVYSAYSTSCIPTYSITYNFAGGTGSHCSNTSVPQGGSYTICDEAPTKEGNTFLHWSDGVNTYNPSDVIATVTTDITLTAVWQPNTYTVIWSNNGVETGVPYNHGDALVVPTAPASCDGVKEFVGWTTHSGYYHATTAPDDIFTTKTTPVTAPATYYAVFATKGAGGTEFVLGESGTFKMYANVNGTNYYAQGGVSSNKLSSTTDILTASDYILTYADGSYTIKQGTSAIGHSSKTDLSTTASTWTISAGANGSWRITSDKDNSRALSYSAEANAFKAYATSNLTAGNETYFDIEFGSGSDAHSDYTTICQTVESIEIANYTTEFFVTDEFAFGGTVTAHFDEGEPQDVTALAHFSGYNMNEVGTYTVTVTYMGATATYEITVKPLDNAWVLTWNVSGKTNTGLGPRSVTKGSAIGTLPTPEVPAACAGKTFMGWTESNIVPSDGKGIVYITGATVPSKNTTYYAVFATINNFSTQAAIEDIDSGSKVVIVAVASMDASGGAGQAISSRTISITSQGVIGLSGDEVSIFDETINTPHSTCIWTLTKEGGGIVFEQGEKYIRAVNNGYRRLLLETTKDYWTLSPVDGKDKTYHMQSGNTSHYVEWFDHTDSKYDEGERYIGFVPYTEANDNGDFDMQFYVTANKDGDADITDYTTGCAEYTITYYGFHGGYSTSCSSDGTIVLPVNSIHTIPDCEGLVINDHTNLGREFLNVWMTQPHGGHTFKPGDTFILTQDTTLYAQWKMETTSDVTTLPTDIEDLAGTDIYVYGGTTLNIQPGTTTINSLTLKGGLQADGSYKMPTVWVPEGATLVRNSNKIYLDLKVNAKNYYPFAVPFATKNDQYLDYLDPVLRGASTYGTHFAIKTYDGTRRAEVGEDRANNWKQLLRHTGGTTSYLEPGVGYIITALTYPDKDTATIRIPMTVPNTWFKNGEQAEVGTTVRNTIAVTAHTGPATDINNGGHQRHAGWNFVANPYLTSFTGGNVANDGGLAYINGKLIIEGSYEYTDEEVPYVTIPAYNFAYYDQVKLSEVKLSPEWSFFVQVGTGGTMNFTTAGRQQAPASIAARNAEERPVKMDVDLILSDNHNSDQTGIIICDRYSDAYEIGRDLEKLFGSAYNLSVYTLMEDNTPLAFQALAIRSSMQVIPVGYRAPEQGEYTFRLNEATSSIDLLNEQYEQLVLVDYQTGELTNLLYTDYTFYSERTQSNSRFAIYAVPRQNAPTDLPNAIGSDEEVRKVIYNDHLYILRDGNVYNGMGQKM